MIQKFKCPNCKRESEIEVNELNGVIIEALCPCGYYMEEIKWNSQKH